MFPEIPLQLYTLGYKYSEGSNVLGLVMFSVVLGITIGKMGAAAKPLQDFFVALSEAMMIITNWVIWYIFSPFIFISYCLIWYFEWIWSVCERHCRISPIGVFFLVAAKLMEIKSFNEIVGQLGWYFMTVLAGLFLHGFGTLTVLFFLATRKFPFSYISQMGQVLATAFGTASR